MFCIISHNNQSAAVIVLALLTAFNYCSPVLNEKTYSKHSKKFKLTAKHEIGVDKSQILVEPLLKFTNNLFGTIRSDKNNVLVSPVSIHAALSMIALGAEPGSETSRELSKGLGYSNVTSEDYHKAYKYTIEKYKKISKLGLEVIKDAAAEDGKGGQKDGDLAPVVDFYNVLITQHKKPLFDNYSEQVTNFYNASVEQIDSSKPETFKKVLNKVNQWAKEAGFEHDILGARELSGDFKAMLLSAVRVQAFWFDVFRERERKIVFYQHGMKDKPVGGMQLVKKNLEANFFEFCAEDKASYKDYYKQVKAAPGSADKLKELADLDCRAIAIRLHGDVSLTIFEPRSVAGQGKELGELANKLFAPNSTKLSSALSILDHHLAFVNVKKFRMPKFDFEDETNLNEPLKALGMSRLFRGTSGGLERITKGEKLFVDEAKHQAMIEVNKFGLKAVGVTTLAFINAKRIPSLELVKYEIKNPFIFMIRHDKIPFFIGQLVKL